MCSSVPLAEPGVELPLGMMVGEPGVEGSEGSLDEDKR